MKGLQINSKILFRSRKTVDKDYSIFSMNIHPSIQKYGFYCLM